MSLPAAEYDVAVIGAGAAGLAAARQLTLNGLSVALIEARGRIGGRLQSLRPPGMAVPVELGGAFVHGRPPETMALVRAASATLYEHEGEVISHFGGQWYADDWEEEDPILESLSRYQGDDVTLDAYMATRFAGAEWEGARRRTLSYVSGFDAADPALVSVRWLAETEKAAQSIQGDRQFLLLDGYDRLMTRLLEGSDSARLWLYLNSVVHQLSWAPQRVTLQLSSVEGAPLPEISATRVIVTVPLGVLKAPPGSSGAIHFDPMPPELKAALAGIEMGDAARVVVRFRDCFWDRDGTPSSFHHPHLSFLVSDHPVMPTWWTNYPLLLPILNGWSAGPRAVELVKKSDEEVKRAALSALADILEWTPAEMDAEVVETYFHNWSRDPFAQGAYSYIRAGGMDSLRVLAQPIADTLYFAGEAIDTAWNTGAVHGALASGNRAAESILDTAS
jgi:monoamine oxidase